MSPFGSMTRAGTPSMAASSSRSMHRPVLPLPVMPDADSVRDQIVAVVQDGVRRCLPRGRIVHASQIERAKFLDVLHINCSCRCCVHRVAFGRVKQKLEPRRAADSTQIRPP